MLSNTRSHNLSNFSWVLMFEKVQLQLPGFPVIFSTDSLHKYCQKWALSLYVTIHKGFTRLIFRPDTVNRLDNCRAQMQKLLFSSVTFKEPLDAIASRGRINLYTLYPLLWCSKGRKCYWGAPTHNFKPLIQLNISMPYNELCF